ncbi:PaaI family thioesterase [Methylibium sp.]|uniref:PaaI family thioesterase n=1 Tax=Methylibium sp. TaxID=2067992 RepID=UPI003D101DF4
MDFPVHIPFVERLGFELLRMADGEAELTVRVRDDLLNSFEVAHGGLTMTLLDVTMAHAARSVNRAQAGLGPGVVTVEMKTSFLRPGEGQLRCHGRLLHRTATLAFCEGRVLTEDGSLCAHATATFKYLRALPAGRREPRSLQRRLGGSGSD